MEGNPKGPFRSRVGIRSERKEGRLREERITIAALLLSFCLHLGIFFLPGLRAFSEVSPPSPEVGLALHLEEYQLLPRVEEPASRTRIGGGEEERRNIVPHPRDREDESKAQEEVPPVPEEILPQGSPESKVEEETLLRYQEMLKQRLEEVRA